MYIIVKPQIARIVNGETSLSLACFVALGYYLNLLENIIKQHNGFTAQK